MTSDEKKSPSASRSSPGRLLVVGTPIGNLEDLSPRAVRALARADAIFCEDTRVTAKLAARFHFVAPRIACPAPREGARTAELVERLARGETVAVVTDAGMPALSDPGAALVAAASREGFAVHVVPGPSAVASALAVSGLPAVPHTFLGFLPARAGERRRFLDGLRGRSETLVWFESPHRLAASLDDAARILGPRSAAVARELTKLHEETLRGPLDELARAFAARGAGRGEATVVVAGEPAGASTEVVDAASLDAAIRRALAQGTGTRALARELARQTGHRPRAIYRRAIELARQDA